MQRARAGQLFDPSCGAGCAELSDFSTIQIGQTHGNAAHFKRVTVAHMGDATRQRSPARQVGLRAVQGIATVQDSGRGISRHRRNGLTQQDVKSGYTGRSDWRDKPRDPSSDATSARMQQRLETVRIVTHAHGDSRCLRRNDGAFLRRCRVGAMRPKRGIPARKEKPRAGQRGVQKFERKVRSVRDFALQPFNVEAHACQTVVTEVCSGFTCGQPGRSVLFVDWSCERMIFA